MRGHAPETMKQEFKKMQEQSKAADEKYNTSIQPELKKFEELINQ
jgi:hypothetical protein